jgi:hypothetical protein
LFSLSPCNELCYMHCFTSPSFVTAFHMPSSWAWRHGLPCGNVSATRGGGAKTPHLVCAGMEDPSVALSQEIYTIGHLPF